MRMRVQRDLAAANEATAASKAAGLREEQAALEQQRLEIKTTRVTGEAQAIVELERLRLQQEALEKKRAEAEIQQANEKNTRLQQAEDLFKQEQELHRRASYLSRTEERLNGERVELHRHRASLAVVQAHVVSMLDKADSGGEAKVHRLDSDNFKNNTSAANQAQDPVLRNPSPRGMNSSKSAPTLPTFTGLVGLSGAEDLGEDDDDNVEVPDDKVWSMDWTSPTLASSAHEDAVAPEA